MEIASSPAQPVEVTLAKSLTVNPRDVLTRYGCQGCHQVQGAGGTLGPSLDNVISEKGRHSFCAKLRSLNLITRRPQCRKCRLQMMSLKL